MAADLSVVKDLILKIDNDEEIMEYRFHGLNSWIVVRYEVFKMLSENQDPGQSSPSANTRVGFWDKVKKKLSYNKYVYKTFQGGPLRIDQHFDCVNFCLGKGMIEGKSGKRNRISGFLNDIREFSTLHAVSSDNGHYHGKYEGNVCFSDALTLRPWKNKQGNSSATHDAFIKRLQLLSNGLLGEGCAERLLQTLHFMEDLAPTIERRVSRFFLKVKPRLVLVEDGSYGGLKETVIIKVAKSMGILTGDIQHGLFDVAFQYGDDLLQREDFKSQKTDYVFTFGEFFSQFINSSSLPIKIGSQHLEEQKKRCLTKPPSGKNKMLFITQKQYTDPIIPLLSESLRRVERGFELVIRLHPFDTGSKEKYSNLFEFSGTMFSIGGDIYEDLKTSEYIIGSCSTSLMEATYFGKIPLIHKSSFSDAYIPAEVGLRFSTSAELTALLSGEPPVAPDVQEYLWTEGCKDNFKNFYDKYVADYK